MSNIPPENKLDDQQREFLEKVEKGEIDNQNYWIRGFPGSGKSVLIAYTYKIIKRKNPKPNVLIVVYTHSLIKRFEADLEEMGIYDAKIVTYFQFRKSVEKYDYILSDEVQDLTPSVLQEMKRRAKHIVVAGDENQSIFESDPFSGELTVSPNQINTLLYSKPFSLNIVHRLSSSIRSAVQKLLPQINIFQGQIDPMHTDTQIRLCEAYNNDEEVKYIVKEAKKAVNIGSTVGVLISTQKGVLSFIQDVIRLEGNQQWNVQLDKYGRPDYSDLNKYLESCRIPLQYVGNGYGNFNENIRKICIMTYHSSKGLDFDNVFLPHLNNSLFIVPNEAICKTLFMVAMTRSRNNLYLTYNGYMHMYLKNIVSDCSCINIHDALNVQQKPNNGGSIFAGF